MRRLAYFIFGFLFFVSNMGLSGEKVVEVPQLKGQYFNDAWGRRMFYAYSDVELRGVQITIAPYSYTASHSLEKQKVKVDGKDVEKNVHVYSTGPLSSAVYLGKQQVLLSAYVESGSAGGRKVLLNEEFDVSQAPPSYQLVATSSLHKVTANDPLPESWKTFGEVSIALGEDIDQTQRRPVFVKFNGGKTPSGKVTVCLDGKKWCLSPKGTKFVEVPGVEFPTGETLFVSNRLYPPFNGMHVTLFEDKKTLKQWKTKKNVEKWEWEETKEDDGRNVFLQDIVDRMNSRPDYNGNGYADDFDGDLGRYSDNTCEHFSKRACSMISQELGLDCWTIYFMMGTFYHAVVQVPVGDGYQYLEPQLNRRSHPGFWLPTEGSVRETAYYAPVAQKP